MKRRGMVGVALISLAALPALAVAQRCAGTASFTGGDPRLSSGVSFTPDTRTISAGIALGEDNSLFAAGSYTYTALDNSNVFTGGFQGTLGYQLAIGSRAQVCPLVSAGSSSAMMYPGYGRTDWSSTAFGLGAMFGFTAAASRNVEVIPSLGLQYLTSSTQAVHFANGTKLASGKRQARMGNLSLTTGFVFRKAITVSPTLSLPLGIDHGRSMYGVGLAYNFGHDR